jgi:hypothetical protein
VDFLLQLVFLGLIVGVIYAVAAKGDKDELKQVEEIKKLLGTSDLTKLTDELTRLAPLQIMNRELESAVSSVGGIQKAKKLLGDQAKKQLGQGHVSCLPNSAVVAVFDAFEDHIEVRPPYTPEFKNLLNELGVRTQIQPMRLDLFATTFSPLLTNHPECRFNARLVEHSHDTRPRDTVSSVFWIKGIERLH